MADKRSRGSIPPPPPPPIPTKSPSNPSSSNSSTIAFPAAPPPSPPPLTNGGVAEDLNKPGVSIKPKPPTKPSRLARRAFSGSSIGLPSFGKIGKARRRSKDIERVISANDGGETGTGMDASIQENGNGIQENGNENGIDKDTLWKLPGIGTIPKLKPMTRSPKLQQKRSNFSDSSLTERDLPPIPSSDTDSETKEKPALPPPPPPPPPATGSGVAMTSCNGKENILNQSKGSSEGMSIEENKMPTVNRNSPSPNLLVTKESHVDADDTIKRFSPLPKTPPSLDSNRKHYRPLPESPPLSDGDEDQVPRPQSPNNPTAWQNASNGTEGAKMSSEEGHLNAASNKAEDKVGDAGESSSLTPAADVTTTVTNGSKNVESEEAASPENKHSSVASLTNHSSSDSSLTPTAAQGETEATEGLKDYTIKEIVNMYSYALPVRVRILQGYCSDTTEVNISTDDIYNIHSVQHTQKVMVKDEDGMMQRVALEAPVKIGLVYNPNNDYDQSLKGYDFKSISEVTAMPVLPKLIAATKTVNCGDEKNSVSEGEILLVKSVQRSMFKGKKGLKVHSLSTKSNKVLLDDCQGQFSTKPSLVRMDLPELLEKVVDVFPSCAVIYPTTDNVTLNADFPGTLSRVVTLLESNADTMLVVSDVSFMDENELQEANLLPVPTTSPNSFDVLLDNDISMLEVVVLRWTYPEDHDGEPEHLYDDTMDLGVERGSSENLDQSLGTNDALAKSPGSARRVDGLSLSVSQMSKDEHTYVNLQQQEKQTQEEVEQVVEAAVPPPVHPKGWMDKEKKFLEEDEDAGYDTVGLHLIGNNPSPSTPDPIEATTPIPNGTNNGYSTVQHLIKKTQEKPPFPDHGYSTVQNRLSKKSPPSSMGYSSVTQHHALKGVVMEVEPEGVETREGHGSNMVVMGGGGGSDGTQLASMMESLESRLKSFQSSSSQQSSEITKMQTMLEMLTTKLDAVESQHTTSPKPAGDVGSKPLNPALHDAPVMEEESTTVERNIKHLKSLNVEQVGQLMEAMGLGQYRQKIIEERISGEILVECDEGILKEEIGMVSRIHCIRLMKVIHGQHSAKTLLEN